MTDSGTDPPTEPGGANRRLERDEGGEDDEGNEGEDPRVIRAIAVTVDDVLTALEANLRANRGVVLRITPPFAGRMRARIHIAGSEGTYTGASRPLHIDPATLVEPIPPYPTPSGTAAELEGDAQSYDVSIHHDRHTERVEAWRKTVRAHLVERATIDGPTGQIDVRVLPLG